MFAGNEFIIWSGGRCECVFLLAWKSLHCQFHHCLNAEQQVSYIQPVSAVQCGWTGGAVLIVWRKVEQIDKGRK